MGLGKKPPYGRHPSFSVLGEVVELNLKMIDPTDPARIQEVLQKLVLPPLDVDLHQVDPGDASVLEVRARLNDIG